MIVRAMKTKVIKWLVWTLLDHLKTTLSTDERYCSADLMLCKKVDEQVLSGISCEYRICTVTVV
jgi:hypothetical protein